MFISHRPRLPVMFHSSMPRQIYVSMDDLHNIRRIDANNEAREQAIVSLSYIIRLHCWSCIRQNCVHQTLSVMYYEILDIALKVVTSCISSQFARWIVICITSVSVFRYYLTEFIYLFLIEIVLITYQFWYHFKVVPKPESSVYFQYIMWFLMTIVNYHLNKLF